MKRKIMYRLGIIAELGAAIAMALLLLTSCAARLFFFKNLRILTWLKHPFYALIPLAIIGVILVVLSTDWRDKTSSSKGIYGTLMVLLSIPILYTALLLYMIVDNRVYIELVNHSGKTFDRVILRDDNHSINMGRFPTQGDPILSGHMVPYSTWIGHALWEGPVLELRTGTQTHVLRLSHLAEGERRVMVLNPNMELVVESSEFPEQVFIEDLF